MPRLMKCLADQSVSVTGLGISERFTAGIEYDVDLAIAPGISRASLLNLDASAGHWADLTPSLPSRPTAVLKPSPAVVPAAAKKE